MGGGGPAGGGWGGKEGRRERERERGVATVCARIISFFIAALSVPAQPPCIIITTPLRLVLLLRLIPTQRTFAKNAIIIPCRHGCFVVRQGLNPCFQVTFIQQRKPLPFPSTQMLLKAKANPSPTAPTVCSSW